MTRTLIWKSQPVVAAHAICAAWIIMRIAMADGDTLPRDNHVQAPQPQPMAIAIPAEQNWPSRSTKSVFMRHAKPPRSHQRSVVTPGNALPQLAVRFGEHNAVPDVIQPAFPSLNDFAIANANSVPESQPPSLSTSPNRAPQLHLSAWMLFRSAGLPSPAAAQGSLSGAQAGMRLTLPLKDTGIGLMAGLSAPLAFKAGREARLGLSIRPKRSWPIEVLAERRIGLDRTTPSRFVVMAAGGISDRPLGKGWTASGYAQLGVAGLRHHLAFVDGELAATRPAFHLGSHPIKTGIGMWGAAQPEMHRIDIGPMLETRIVMADRPVRISLQWRERVSGHVRPRSGPALVIGSDF